jgi:Co/Zn/Cd efflux system component
MYASAIIAFVSIGKTKPPARYVALGVRALGLLALVFLAWKFRDGHGHHLRHSWWGILGLIGWAYFVATLLYVVLRNEHPAALVGAVAMLMCMFFADKHGAFDHLRLRASGHVYDPTNFVDFGETLGSQAAITMAGVLLGATLLPRAALHFARPIDRIRFAAVFAVLLAACALLLHRPYGINKNAATPAWCLWSAAITTVMWIGLYAVIDVARFWHWSVPLAWAGANALLIYLPVELTGWEQWWRWGTYPTVAYRGLAIAAALALVAGVLGRFGLRLKL